MDSSSGIFLLIVLGVLAANLPWFSDRLFGVFSPPAGGKGPWLRAGEWLLMYPVFLAAGFGLQRAVDGGLHGQGWAFYALTLALFAVFAAPGVIWRKDLRPLLRARR